MEVECALTGDQWEAGKCCGCKNRDWSDVATIQEMLGATKAGWGKDETWSLQMKPALMKS